MGWRWNAGRALRSVWRAIFELVVQASDARFLPPLEPFLALQVMTVIDRVSGVRSGSLLQQISSIGAESDWTAPKEGSSHTNQRCSESTHDSKGPNRHA